MAATQRPVLSPLHCYHNGPHSEACTKSPSLLSHGPHSEACTKSPSLSPLHCYHMAATQRPVLSPLHCYLMAPTQRPVRPSGLNVKETSAAERPFSPRNFEPVRVLGQGVYGKVVLVYDRAADLNFAVKLIPVEPNPEYDARQYVDIMKEKLIMEKLALRSCFTQSYFTTLTKQYAWFGLHYYAGGSLKDLIKYCSTDETKKLSFRDAQSIIAEILLSVKKLHGKHILHRDIKLDNFLIDNKGHIVLSDFGLSVALDKTKPVEEQVSCEYFVGENEFTAPEMTIRPASYSYPADLYSVGKTIGLLCAAEGSQDGTWTNDQKDDAVDLQAVLTAHSPSTRATIKKVAKHRFFKGIRWKEVESGNLDMTKFGPREEGTQKPASHCDVDLGSLDSADVVSPILTTFSECQRYLQMIQEE